jgi:hypothetical protein
MCHAPVSSATACNRQGTTDRTHNRQQHTCPNAWLATSDDAVRWHGCTRVPTCQGLSRGLPHSRSLRHCCRDRLGRRPTAPATQQTLFTDGRACDVRCTTDGLPDAAHHWHTQWQSHCKQGFVPWSPWRAASLPSGSVVAPRCRAAGSNSAALRCSQRSHAHSSAQASPTQSA